MVAFYRLALSVLILLVPFLARHTRERIQRRDIAFSAMSGTFLALHFATWFLSLRLTSVTSSTVLVSTHPFFVLLYSYVLRGTKPAPQSLAAVTVAMAGAGIIAWGDLQLHMRATGGDLLALLGAAAMAAYLIIGQRVRQRISTIAYSTLAYISASLVLLTAALLQGSPLWGFESFNWWVFAALALFPTIFGHTLFNWALRYLPAAVLSVTILAEPIGASFLAWLIWRTIPGPLVLAGSALLLTGIGWYLIRQQRQGG